eukprot:2257070-Rhodomonas_salina.2
MYRTPRSTPLGRWRSAYQRLDEVVNDVRRVREALRNYLGPASLLPRGAPRHDDFKRAEARASLVLWNQAHNLASALHVAPKHQSCPQIAQKHR